VDNNYIIWGDEFSGSCGCRVDLVGGVDGRELWVGVIEMRNFVNYGCDK
jgi:hypothetical protein